MEPTSFAYLRNFDADIAQNHQQGAQGLALAGLKMIDSTQELLNGLAELGGKVPRIKEIAFGTDFIRECERIKIKGE